MRAIDTSSPPVVVTLADAILQVPSTQAETGQYVAERLATPDDATAPVVQVEQEDIASLSAGSASVITPIGLTELTFEDHVVPLVVSPPPVNESELDEVTCFSIE